MSPEQRAESPAPPVTVGETTYTARRSITIEGADESADTYRRALEAARAAGIPDDARMNAFSSSRSASFSFTWTVWEVPVRPGVRTAACVECIGEAAADGVLWYCDRHDPAGAAR